jgi:hypothetical protein
MPVPSGWVRVSRRQPCPVCQKPDWCLLRSDGTAAICARVESDRRAGDAGWLHLLVEQHARPCRPERLAAIYCSSNRVDWQGLSVRCVESLTADRLHALAQTLGVGVDGLRRLRVGWLDSQRCWTFPMCDSMGRIVGVKRRFLNGDKRTLRGGREGLFVPHDLPERVPALAICEGLSDTAAALSLGLIAVGRPSCLGCVAHCVHLARQREVQSVAVIADNDAPGIAGARRLAIALRPYVPDVRVAIPPLKDLREWVRGGATQGEVIELIEQAERVSLKTRSHEWSRT